MNFIILYEFYQLFDRILNGILTAGQAAAVAVHTAKISGENPREIDGKLIRRKLIDEEGVDLDHFPGGWWEKLRDKKGELVVNSGDAVSII